MINPINLIKLDNVADENGKTFHIGPLPEYDQEDYDLTNPKDFQRYIKDVKAEIRGSFEYRDMVRTLKEDGGMDRSGLNPNISNSDGSKVKIEIHHTPLVLEDIVKTVYEKRRYYHEDLSVDMVAKEVMECHYKSIVGLFPVTATEHELIHAGYLFIPPENVYGNYKAFTQAYDQFMDPEDKETLESIEEFSKSFDPSDQMNILKQSNIYLDPNGAYQIPNLNNLGERMTLRIDTIKNNMYSLPVLQDNNDTQNKMIEGVYFVDDEGNRV